MASYAMYGEDPIVVPEEPGNGEVFSPHEYAREYVEKICK